MPHFCLILFLLIMPGITRSQGIAFPPSPDGQVFDPSGWLGEDRIHRLEEELGRFRQDHAVDVIVVLWSRGIPPRASMEDLAQRIGDAWSRQPLWAVVLHVPESLHRPVVVTRSDAEPLPGDQSIEVARQTAVTRGMKEPHTRARVEALALETAEELTFWTSRILLGEDRATTANAHILPSAQLTRRSFPAIATISGSVALCVLTLMGILSFRKRRYGPLFFPETNWKRRLRADWSGGNNITVSIPQRPS